MDHIDPSQTDDDKAPATEVINNRAPSQSRAAHFVAGFFLPYLFYLALLLLFQIGSCSIGSAITFSLAMLFFGAIVLPFIHLINLSSGFFFREKQSKTIKQAYKYMLFILLFIIALLGMTSLSADMPTHSCDIHWH